MWNNLQCINCLKRACFLAAGTSALSLLQVSQDATSHPGRLAVGGACQPPLETLSPVSCVRWHVWHRDVLLVKLSRFTWICSSALPPVSLIVLALTKLHSIKLNFVP